MHYRFRGNPATNDAARLLAENKRRATKGQQPLTLAEFTNQPEPAPPIPAPKPAKPQLKLF